MAQRTTRKRTRDGRSVVPQTNQQGVASPAPFENFSNGYRAPVKPYPAAGQYLQYAQQHPPAMNQQTYPQNNVGSELTKLSYPVATGPVQPYDNSISEVYPMINNAAVNSMQGGFTEDEELERRANLAKRDADGKKRQIPPFIQKLSR